MRQVHTKVFPRDRLAAAQTGWRRVVASPKPLAIIEVKRTRRDARAGQQQAKLYADCLEAMYGQRPVIFYTNGYEHWLWDDRDQPPRPVQGFLKKDELALLIQPYAPGQQDPALLEEFMELARSAGATVVGTLMARVEKPNAAYYIGTGKLEEAQAACEATGADLVLVNHLLTPGQERNLEKALKRIAQAVA